MERSINLKRIGTLFILFFGFSSFSAFAVVTLKKVELKNFKNEWVTIIEPDRSVDPARRELGVTLVNNGRVPEGQYLNFRVTLSEFVDRHSKEKNTLIFLRSDLAQPLRVQRGSFIGIWFHLDWKEDVARSELSEAEVTVDETTQTINGAEIIHG